jgi:hypothetical protein
MMRRDEMIEKVDGFIRQSASRIETALNNLEKGGSAVAGMNSQRKAEDYKQCLTALDHGRKQLMTIFGHDAKQQAAENTSLKAAPAA